MPIGCSLTGIRFRVNWVPVIGIFAFFSKNQYLPVYSGIKKNGVFHRCEIKADPQVTLLRRFWRAPYGSAGTGFAGARVGADCNFGQSVLF